MDEQTGSPRFPEFSLKNGFVFGLGFHAAGLLFGLAGALIGFTLFTRLVAPTLLPDEFRRVSESSEATATLKADLRNLAAAEETYFADNLTYTSDPEALDFAPTEGVILRIMSADAQGWGAVALLDGQLCGLFYGSASHQLHPAQYEGVVGCEEPLGLD